jgi:hypothetical protein
MSVLFMRGMLMSAVRSGFLFTRLQISLGMLALSVCVKNLPCLLCTRLHVCARAVVWVCGSIVW